MKEKQLAISELSAKDVETLISVGAIPRGTPENVIRFFSRACAESRLSPFRKQVHLIKRGSQDGDRYTLQTAIDGYRTIADRTGRYAGNDDYVFNGTSSEWDMVESGKERPDTATATVWKIVGGVRCPFSATVRWKEYYPGERLGFMWNKMPFLMLGKCAEALAIRKAFPEETSGIYTDEEMISSDVGPVIERAKIPKISAGNGVQTTTTPPNVGWHGPPTDKKESDKPDSPAETPSPKKKPLLKRKNSLSRQNTLEKQMLERLKLGNRTPEDLLKVAVAYEWCDADEVWPLTEEKLELFLEPENFAVLMEEMDNLPASVMHL
jgi:phage recombination protein Bet